MSEIQGMKHSAYENLFWNELIEPKQQNSSK